MHNIFCVYVGTISKMFVTSPFPDFVDALYNYDPSTGDDFPDSIDISHDQNTNIQLSIFIAQLAVMSKSREAAYIDRMKQVTEKFLRTGKGSVDVFREIRKSIIVNVNYVNFDDGSEGRKTCLNKDREFAKRINLYNEIDHLSSGIVDEIRKNLISLGFASTPKDAGKLLSCGRREKTCAAQLIKAISKIEDVSIRTECNMKFESLARQIWDWKYPILSAEQLEILERKFNVKQEQLIESKINVRTNITIRMLYHFHQINFPFDILMFRLPEGDESWTRNLTNLGTFGIWDPRISKI